MSFVANLARRVAPRALRPATRAFGTTAPNAAAKQMTVESLNQNYVSAEYAVRGEIVLRALELEAQVDDKPFDEVVFCNIGNPQQLNQRPVSFFREVLALTACPDLLAHPDVGALFSPDAVARAQLYADNIPGGTGAYSHSKGVAYLRGEVAAFIEARDGVGPVDPEDVFITDGASPAVQYVLKLLLRGPEDGVMIPIPQYPLYSACITMCGGTQVPYYLDEATGWGLDVAELQRSLDEARAAGTNVRALAVINPGNPTGACLDRDNVAAVADFCAKEKLVLLADEVYQENNYAEGLPFHSFKKVAHETGALADGLELASFHSVSKGFLGECGRRGGYVEFAGIDAAVKDELYKTASVNLCSNLDGQIMVGLMVNPPADGTPARAQYDGERKAILDSLKRRALKLRDTLNTMEGVSCADVQGAMYAFPSITLPPKAVAAAEAAGKAPDAFYCLALLEATGVVVVPGSGFGQREGTWHFRTTILPAEDQIDKVTTRMAAFHADFMAEYS